MIYDLQKASMWKRISAFLFDGILLGIVAVLFAWGLAAALDVDGYQTRLDEYYARYGQEYGVNFQLTLTEYEAMTQAEIENLERAYAAFSADEDAIYVSQMLMQLTILIITFGILLGFILLEFILPAILGNGQTLGKKIFGIGLMSLEGIRITRVALFVRTMLGKYAVETMVPVLILMMIFFGVIGIVGTAVLGMILLLQFILILATRRHTLIHDLLAQTVCIDVASQMIFNTREEKIAYIQKVHAEKAANAAY